MKETGKKGSNDGREEKTKERKLGRLFQEEVRKKEEKLGCRKAERKKEGKGEGRKGRKKTR